LDREELIPLSEAAALSGLSLKHLGLLARRGKLRAHKIGRNWVTSREAVAAYVRDSFERSRDPYKRQR
jgi:excisionase family DNA binding protein